MRLDLNASSRHPISSSRSSILIEGRFLGIVRDSEGKALTHPFVVAVYCLATLDIDGHARRIVQILNIYQPSSSYLV